MEAQSGCSFWLAEKPRCPPRFGVALKHLHASVAIACIPLLRLVGAQVRASTGRARASLWGALPIHAISAPACRNPSAEMARPPCKGP